MLARKKGRQSEIKSYVEGEPGSNYEDAKEETRRGGAAFTLRSKRLSEGKTGSNQGKGE